MMHIIKLSVNFHVTRREVILEFIIRYKGTDFQRFSSKSFKMLFLLTLLCIWPVLTLSSSVDYFSLIEDYSRNVKSVHTITLLSCPTRFNVNSWITANSTPEYLFRFVDTTAGDLNLSPIVIETNCRQLIALDLGCPGYKRIIAQLSLLGHFNSLCRAFLLLNTRAEDPTFYDNELRTVFSETNFTFISDVAFGTGFPIGRQIGNETFNQLNKFFIYDVWNPGRQQGGELTMDLIGVYRQQENQGKGEEEEEKVMQFHELDDRIMFHRRLDLSGLHLHCAIVVTSPFNDTLESYITHNYNPYLDTVHRLNFRTIGLVQDYYNFKLRVRRVHSWGYVQNASAATSFDGMVGMVQRGEVDFGCSPAWFRLERLQVVDYGAQTWAIRPLFLFRHPNTRGLGKNVFLEPFEDPVWLVLLVSSVVIILLMANAIQQDKRVLGRTEEDIVQLQEERMIHLLLSKVEHVFKSFVQSTRIYVSVILQQGVGSRDSS